MRESGQFATSDSPEIELGKQERRKRDRSYLETRKPGGKQKENGNRAPHSWFLGFQINPVLLQFPAFLLS